MFLNTQMLVIPRKLIVFLFMTVLVQMTNALIQYCREIVLAGKFKSVMFNVMFLNYGGLSQSKILGCSTI